MDGVAIAEHARMRARLVVRIRQRAWCDAALVLALTAGAAMLAQTAHEALLAASAALSLGILCYVMRRDRDLTRLAADSRWREEAVAGRGLDLGAWKKGAPLEAWSVRRDERVQEVG